MSLTSKYIIKKMLKKEEKLNQIIVYLTYILNINWATEDFEGG